MVGIVVVSHSRPLAEAAVALAKVMLSEQDPPRIAIAAGVDGEFGTAATDVMTAIDEVRDGDGVALFVDMGSAVMSAETAVDMLDYDDVRILAAPFVEGLTAGLVRAANGGSLDDVATAAEGAAAAKYTALGRPAPSVPDASAPDAAAAPAEGASPGGEGFSEEVTLVNPIGLHARPAARLATLANKFEAETSIEFGDNEPVDAKSTMNIMALGARYGDKLIVHTEGPGAEQALRELVDFIASGLGDGT